MILRLDFKTYSTSEKNTAIIEITNYIVGVWYAYKLGLYVEKCMLEL